MNYKVLQDLYLNNPSVQEICDHFADRDQAQSVTKISRMIYLLRKDGVAINRSKVIEAFKRLEEVGCGCFIKGAHGHPSRFEWSENSRTVGRAACGESSTDQEDVEMDLHAGESDQIDVDQEFIVHVFQLRPTLSISIELPQDLSEAEAQRLARFVQSLPFDL